METLVPAVPLSHSDTAVRSRRSAVSPTRIPLPSAVCGLPTGFITYAVEIKGDAPLYFFAEAVDD